MADQWVVVRPKFRKDSTELVHMAAYGPFDCESLAAAFAYAYGEQLKHPLTLLRLNAELDNG